MIDLSLRNDATQIRYCIIFMMSRDMLIFPCGIMRHNSTTAEYSVFMIYRD